MTDRTIVPSSPEVQRPWVCWDCDAGDHFLCNGDDVAILCSCECRDGRDAFLLASK